MVDTVALTEGVAEAPPASESEVEEAAAWLQEIVAAVAKVVVGHDDAIRLSVACLLAGGHLLVEDVPGVGKTTLARALAAAIGAQWQRVQCTPDLLPTDLTGVHVPVGEVGSTARRVELRRGPLFAEVVMADELNRASPRTQAALLEAMEERQITLDGVTYPLPRPFFVVATQNPDDFEGTYPLPESQLDRFLFRLHLGFPSVDAEMSLLRQGGSTFGSAPETVVVDAVTVPAELLRIAGIATRVYLAPALRRYLVELAGATRREPRLHPGVSPRALLGLAAAARVWAAVHGRNYVLPDDLLELVEPTLAHRLGLGVIVDRAEVSALLDEIVRAVPVPFPER
ncbi:MAG TPA: MoxR family ATPase [Acidimicrobiales bacterium]|nr:MoxR family ATPase [Acidimicrobiales bacterium]